MNYSEAVERTKTELKNRGFDLIYKKSYTVKEFASNVSSLYRGIQKHTTFSHAIPLDTNYAYINGVECRTKAKQPNIAHITL